MKVAILSPCFVDQFSPNVSINCRRILEKFGCEVEWLDSFCCGQPAMNSGFRTEATQVGTNFINTIPKDAYIVIPSSSCCGFIKNYYDKLDLSDNTMFRYKEIKNNIFEFSDFLIEVLKVDFLNTNYKGKVAYHPSCASIREMKISDKVLSFLNEKTDLDMVTFQDPEVCCGFGGTFAVKFSEISVSMGNFKIERFKKAGVQMIISNDVSCLLHIGSLLKKENCNIKINHIADVLF